MSAPAQPKSRVWYRLPDTTLFQVTKIDNDAIWIEYPDGAGERLDMLLWNRLGAVAVVSGEGWRENPDTESETESAASDTLHNDTKTLEHTAFAAGCIP